MERRGGGFAAAAAEVDAAGGGEGGGEGGWAPGEPLCLGWVASEGCVPVLSALGGDPTLLMASGADAEEGSEYLVLAHVT